MAFPRFSWQRDVHTCRIKGLTKFEPEIQKQTQLHHRAGRKQIQDLKRPKKIQWHWRPLPKRFGCAEKHQRDRAGKSWEAENVWQRGLNEFLIPHCMASLFLNLFSMSLCLSLSRLPSLVFIVSKETRRRQMTYGFRGNQSTIK